MLSHRRGPFNVCLLFIRLSERVVKQRSRYLSHCCSSKASHDWTELKSLEQVRRNDEPSSGVAVEASSLVVNPNYKVSEDDRCAFARSRDISIYVDRAVAFNNITIPNDVNKCARASTNLQIPRLRNENLSIVNENAMKRNCLELLRMKGLAELRYSGRVHYSTSTKNVTMEDKLSKTNEANQLARKVNSSKSTDISPNANTSANNITNSAKDVSHHSSSDQEPSSDARNISVINREGEDNPVNNSKSSRVKDKKSLLSNDGSSQDAQEATHFPQNFQPKDKSLQNSESTATSVSAPSSLASQAAVMSKSQNSSPNKQETELSKVPRPKGLLGYIISRYTWYIERLQRTLENEMPRTFKMFRIFSVGLKAFVTDFGGYVRVMVTLSFPKNRLENLSLQQLELYHLMPADMIRVFPVLAMSAVPFGQNVALPLGYFFPRQLLCRHFWDLQQTHDFSIRALRLKLYYARPVFRCIQANVEGIQPLADRVRAQAVCHNLGSGVHPTTEQVIKLRPLFAGKPYAIDAVKHAHLKALVRLYGLRAPLGRRMRLKEHARWLKCHDVALEGGLAGDEALDHISALHVNTLRNSLMLRGISPIGLDSRGMVELLQKWLIVSRQLERSDASLLLHLPVLLFYNYPPNLDLRRT